MCRAECLQLHYDLDLCHLGAGTDVNALRSQRRDWQASLNRQIQNIMLELVVNTFRLGDVPTVGMDKNIINRDAVLVKFVQKCFAQHIS